MKRLTSGSPTPINASTRHGTTPPTGRFPIGPPELWIAPERPASWVGKRAIPCGEIGDGSSGWNWFAWRVTRSGPRPPVRWTPMVAGPRKRASQAGVAPMGDQTQWATQQNQQAAYLIRFLRPNIEKGTSLSRTPNLTTKDILEGPFYSSFGQESESARGGERKGVVRSTASNKPSREATFRCTSADLRCASTIRKRWPG